MTLMVPGMGTRFAGRKGVTAVAWNPDIVRYPSLFIAMLINDNAFGIYSLPCNVLRFNDKRLVTGHSSDYGQRGRQ